MAEKRTIDLEIKDNAGSLKARLAEATKELQAIAEKFGETSKEAINAAEKVADLKNKIQDTKEVTNAINPDKFQAVSGALGSVSNGLDSVKQAMGMFGIESEKVEKIMLGVKNALTLVRALEDIKEAKKQFQLFGSVAKTALSGVKAGVAATGIGLLVIALGTMAAYWDDISKAVGISGDEMEKTKEKQKALTKSMKDESSAVAKNSAEFIGLVYQLKATNAKSKERADLIKKINGQYNTTLKNLSDEAAFQKQLNAEVADYVTYQKAKYKLQQNEEKVQRNLATQAELESKISKVKAEQAKQSKYISTLSKEEQKEANKAAKIGDKILKDYQKQLDDANKRLEGYGKVALETNSKISTIEGTTGRFNESFKKTAETTKNVTKETEKYSDALINYLNAIEDKRQSEIKSAQEREEQEVANKYEKLYLLADEAGQDSRQLLIEQANEIGAIRIKYKNLEIEEKKKKEEELAKLAKETEDKQLEEMFALEQLRIDHIADVQEKELAVKKLGWSREQAELQKSLDTGLITQELYEQYKKETTERYLSETKELQKKYSDDENKRRQENIDQYLDLAKQQFQALGDLAMQFNFKSKSAQKAAFNVKKGADIASATIDTYKAAQSAYASMSGIPVAGPALGAAAAAIAVTAGLLNVKKIASQKFEGGSISGGGSGGGSMSVGGLSGGAQAPSFNVVGNNGLNQLQQLQQQPVQAFVVSGNVTTAQSLDRNRITNATL